MTTGDWGVDGWGVGPWGGGEDPVHHAIVEAIRENVVRATFEQSVLLTGLLDKKDSLSPIHYFVTAESGVGLDDEPIQTVAPILIERVVGDPRSIDIYVDRPFSRFPTIYSLRCVNMYDPGGALFAATITETFYGLRGAFEKPVLSTYIPQGTRDFANPSAREALFDPLPEITDANLGTFPYGDDGDYGYDEGLENLKKRVIRRCIVRPGGFVWLPNYGVAIVEEGKRLNNAARREDIKARIRDQVGREPDIRYVAVNVKYLPSTPGIVWFIIKVLTVSNRAFKFDVPFVST